jgi:cytochrome c-type biogenesis protein CcmH
MSRLLATLALCLLACARAALGAEAQPLAEDPVVEQRMIAITQDLRCLVCQNESLAGSRAPLAEDLRREVRELIRQNKSDQQIVDYLVARYGNFVRYKPPFEPSTALLWLGPFALLAAGMVLLLRRVRRAGQADEPPLDASEREHAEQLLAQGAPGEPT